ncbi:unnamed protein product [Phytophthora lilii]|uniref:Unnamed protein product n=1 Tax=Phytophthora lilii TaxID=2077276 RepID=A0A9W6X3U2_9STRA|nr:unnamed protein product [Phytophthora lilii]
MSLQRVVCTTYRSPPAVHAVVDADLCRLHCDSFWNFPPSTPVIQDLMNTEIPPPPEPEISFESAKTLMTEGPQAFHDIMASKIEATLGRPLPRMEVRLNPLATSAAVEVRMDTYTANHNASFDNLRTLTDASPRARSRYSWVSLSGKTALMKILSRRLFPMNQRDKHFSTLTVKETLEFAHTFCGGKLLEHAKGVLAMGFQHDEQALEALKIIFALYPDIVIQQLVLQICQDTVVGDNTLRGVSGGERKRVTTGEMEFGMRCVAHG